jgi:exodeoxyribonuclease VII small subunit
MTKEKKPTFEAALKRLEEIVALMEDEHTPLDEALKRYEEGIGLARFCARSLDEAEKKIEILSATPDGGVAAVPFSEPKVGEPSDPPNAAPPKRRTSSPRPVERNDGETLLF